MVPIKIAVGKDADYLTGTLFLMAFGSLASKRKPENPLTTPW